MQRRWSRRRMLFAGGAFGMSAAIGAGPARAQAGFFVPAEDVAHERCFMQWPVWRQVYPDPVFLEMVQETVADIANTIADFERVTLLAERAEHTRARRLLSDAVELWDVPTEDLWCRDAGPIFVTDGAGGLAVRQIQFNGWGGDCGAIW